MSDLVIHVGMPKTGSTTLQKHFFSACRNNTNNEETKELLEIFRCHQKNKIKTRRNIVEWGNRISAKYHNSDPIIVSDEHFCSAYLNKLQHFPFVEHNPRTLDILPLAEFIRDLVTLWSWGEVKCLLCVRDHADWIGSQYAQGSDRLINACQSDFEERLRSFLKNGAGWINWDLWYRHISSAAGEDNTFVISTESLNTEKTAQKLENLTGREVSAPHFEKKLLKSTKKENKRALGDNEWQLRPFRLSSFVTEKLLMNNFWSYETNVKQRAVVLSLSAFSLPADVMIKSVSKTIGRGSIFVTQNLRDRIKGCYGKLLNNS